MTSDFAFYLTLAVLMTGVITIIDMLFFAKRRRLKNQSTPLLMEYGRAFFPLLLLVWGIRSFVVQPYRVPTGSLEPTVMPGDFIAVEQFAYGLRLPVLDKKILAIGEPKRGDITLFRWPEDTKIIFVKRVIGLPGDHVVYKNKILYVNEKKIPQIFLRKTYDLGEFGNKRLVYEKEENLEGIKHNIYVQPVGGETKDYDLKVPRGYYFMMGDNRDNSDDSRQLGFVPEKDLVGKAFGIWMSWDPVHRNIRWHRIGTSLR